MTDRSKILTLYINLGKLRKLGQLAGLAVFAGCSGPPTGGIGLIAAADTACRTGVAEIRVGDGFMQTLCGCVGPGETSGAVFSTPGTLTCTLASPTTAMFFYFTGNVLQHQIIPLGTPSFVASPLIGPGAPGTSTTISTTTVHAVTFGTPATTYQFEDSINGLTGQIIVP